MAISEAIDVLLRRITEAAQARKECAAELGLMAVTLHDPYKLDRLYVAIPNTTHGIDVTADLARNTMEIVETWPAPFAFSRLGAQPWADPALANCTLLQAPSSPPTPLGGDNV